MSFYEGKKVLVTGGTGFCGRHIVNELYEQGAMVVVTSRTAGFDLTQEDACLDVVKGMDYVFHFAGAVGNAGAGPDVMMSAITTNLILTTRMLNACRGRVERLLLCGSSTVYPEGNYPMKETDLDGPTHPAYFGYGEMYRYIEKLADLYSSDLQIARVRSSAVYGPGDTSGHVIPSLIRRALAKEDPFVVWGDGNQTRDFLHVTDLAKGCLMMLEKHAVNDPVNIGYGSSIKIDELASLILSTSEHSIKPIFDTGMPTAISHRQVDVSKAKSLGFEAQVSLEEGIQNTVEWFNESRPRSD